MQVDHTLTGFRFVDHYRVNNIPTLDGYSVPFTLNYIPGSDPFFRDIQPYTNGVKLPFWIEHAAGTTISTNTPFTSPKIWIRLPKGCTDLDIYRKNPRMTADRSDGNRTFDFFDDFTTGSVVDANKWETDKATTSISNGLLTSTITSNTGYVRSIGTYNAGYACRMRSAGKATNNTIDRGFRTAGVAGYVLTELYATDGLFYYLLDGTSTKYTTATGDTNYHIWDWLWASNYVAIYDNGALKVDSSTANEIATNNLKVSIVYSGQTPETYTDWVLVRKYQSPEPTPILLSTKSNPMWKGA